MTFFATAASIVGIVGGGIGIANSIRGSRSAGAAGAEAAAAADPFASQRSQYFLPLNQSLMGLNNFDPNSIRDDPSYKFQLEEGLNGLDLSSSSIDDTIRSGRRQQGRMEYASGLASSFSEKKFARMLESARLLMGASGATSGSPGAAAGAIQGGEAARYAREQEALRGAGSLFTTIRNSNWNFGNPSGGSNIGDPNMYT